MYYSVYFFCFVKISSAILLQRKDGNFKDIRPERKSGGKNILALTEVDIFFSSEARPRLQTVLTAFRLWDAVRNL